MNIPMIPFIIFFANSAIFVLIALSILLTYHLKSSTLIIAATASGTLSWMIGWIIKNLFYLPRPFITSGQPPIINYITDGSFPSLHTTLAFAIAFTISFFEPYYGIPFVVISILIALSRIMGGVHTTADVMGGIILALVISFTIFRLSKLRFS